MRRYAWIVALPLLATAGLASADALLQFNPFPGDPFNNGVWWWAQGGFPSTVTNGESNLTDQWPANDFMSCVDADSGKPIDCTYSWQLVGVDTGFDDRINFGTHLTDAKMNGGHSHGTPGTRPLYYQEPGTPALEVSGGGPYTMSSDGRMIQGHTAQGVDISFWLPEEATSIWVDEFIVAPEGWICVSGCFNRTTWEYHETLLTGYAGFQQLDLNYATDGSYPYYISRNQQSDPGHTDANAEWGTQYTLDGVRAIASVYESVTPWHGVMPLNDMSLPEGGLFDIHDDWNLGAKQEHLDHRVGTSVDVDPTDSQQRSIPCPNPASQYYVPGPNNYLYGILYERHKTPPAGTATPAPPAGTHNLPVGLRAAVFCESGGRLHMTISSDNPQSLVPLTPVQP